MSEEDGGYSSHRFLEDGKEESRGWGGVRVAYTNS
jgi:hypothetical protein